MATVQIRVDSTLKSRVDELYSSLGLDTTTAVRMFFMASLEHDGIPFDVRHTPDYSLQAAILDKQEKAVWTPPRSCDKMDMEKQP